MHTFSFIPYCHEIILYNKLDVFRVMLSIHKGYNEIFVKILKIVLYVYCFSSSYSLNMNHFINLYIDI